MSKLHVSNSLKTTLKIIVEPWGRVTELAPGAAFMFEPVAPSRDFYWSLVWGPDGWVSAYAEGSCDELTEYPVKRGQRT